VSENIAGQTTSNRRMRTGTGKWPSITSLQVEGNLSRPSERWKWSKTGRRRGKRKLSL